MSETRLETTAVGLSLAGVGAIVYLACTFLFFISPEFAIGVLRQVFHAAAFNSAAQINITINSTAAGLLVTLIFCYVIGLLSAKFYNAIAKQENQDGA